MSIDGEIVGLRDKSNGRQCNLHACCGDNIRPGSIVTFKLAMVLIHGKKEEAIKVVHVVDGKETCTVGFCQNLFLKIKGIIILTRWQESFFVIKILRIRTLGREIIKIKVSHPLHSFKMKSINS